MPTCHPSMPACLYTCADAAPCRPLVVLHSLKALSCHHHIRRCMAGRASFPSDVWSLGMTVLHMHTGQPPWDFLNHPGEHLQQPQLMYHVGQPGNNHPVPETVPGFLRGLLQACINRDPRARPSASMMREHPCLSETVAPSSPQPLHHHGRSSGIATHSHPPHVSSPSLGHPAQPANASGGPPSPPAAVAVSPRPHRVTPVPLSPKHSSLESWIRNAPPPPSGAPSDYP